MSTGRGTAMSEALVERIYNCVAHPDDWPSVLDTVRLAVGGRVGVIGVIDSARELGSEWVWHARRML